MPDAYESEKKRTKNWNNAAQGEKQCVCVCLGNRNVRCSSLQITRHVAKHFLQKDSRIGRRRELEADGDGKTLRWSLNSEVPWVNKRIPPTPSQRDSDNRAARQRIAAQIELAQDVMNEQWKLCRGRPNGVCTKEGKLPRH